MPPRKSTSRTSSAARQQQVILSVLAFAALVVVYFGLNVVFPAIFPSDPTVIPPVTSGPATLTPASQGQPPTRAAQPALPAWLTLYLTNPNPPDDIENGIDRFILPLLENARQSIDVVSFDVNLPSVVNALIAAHQRGVQVRVIYDGEEGDAEVDNDFVGLFNGVEALHEAGVPMVDGGRSNGLMHNKIILIDGKTLVMGSWNVSYNDTFRNNNNVLVITAPEIIANYQAKFDEGFVDGRFGTQALVGPPNPTMTLDGVAVENYFSPEDEVMEKLVAYVLAAKKSVHFYAFTYTHADLSTAMITQFNNGLDVQGVIENRGASQGALVPLYCAKVPVKTDGNKYTMHHKVIVLDGETVITGSYNFTKSADNANDDNILVIHSPALAQLYEEEYQRMLAIAQDPDPAKMECTK
jgi:phosphatidylserine/phosphatidylglycerophosphate/cardiolipin synthase-like enzyme